MATKLAAEHLSLYFGDHKVLDDITLPIAANQVTAIMGPSGSGKSTLLRAFNRMHELVPSGRNEGSITLNGEEVHRRDPVELRRMIGMVFQRANPFPTLSVYDNAVAGLKLNGVRTKQVLDEVAEHSLRQAGLWEELEGRLGTGGAQLSGGQQQRLCIARAVAVEPEVLLMDEPTSALDPISTQRIEELIRELSRGYTIVIVTHNLQQAARVSDTTAFVNLDQLGKPGHLVEYDRADKIFTNPSSKVTERYISGGFG